MSLSKIYLGLGTNLGDRLLNLRNAISSLESVGVTVVNESSIYKTPPWGETNQPEFLNMCLACETNLNPEELLKSIKNLEIELGREETYKWGPRLIDIDILFYDQLSFKKEDLSIPHPGITERAFVLVPLADIAAEFIHPILSVSVKDLVNQIDTSDVKKFA